jgi:hypothetical protein
VRLLRADSRGAGRDLSGDYAAAEKAWQQATAVRGQYPVGGVDEERTAQLAKAWAALAIARQGRAAEAAGLVNPVVEYERGLAAHNKGDLTQRFELAQVLYVQSLTDKSRQAALRREALGLIDRFPESFRRLRSVVRWRQLIQAAN